MEFKYLKQPPRKYTFEQESLKLFVESYCRGRVLNLFAGKTRLNADETRVDVSNEMNPDFCMDAYDFVSSWDKFKFDTVVLDPPYNVRKSREKYSVGEEVYYIGKLTKIKNKLPEIIHHNARIITLGYDSVGMSNIRGFVKEAICLVCHGGDHNDTICLVEIYFNQQLKLFT